MKTILILVCILFMGCADDIDTSTASQLVLQFNKNDKCEVIDKQYYKVCYDNVNRGAVYNVYTLQNVDTTNIPKRPSFYTETNEAINNPVLDNEYDYLGYDRGHIASDASFDYSVDSLHAVYSLINIVPQTPQLNRIAWKKTEVYERELYLQYKLVTVLVLITYNNTFIKGLSIPNTMTKIFMYNNQYECYTFNNVFDKAYNHQPLNNYRVDCETLKR